MSDAPRPKEPPVPPQRVETARQSLLEELRRGAATARALGVAVGMREKEVLAHLEHIERSLSARGEKLQVVPAACLGCGYVFEDRRAFARPSRCPRCRGERIEAPRFGIHNTD
ncbi:transcriptional regulator [Polyangium aurulentum]|uniref:transcriptional regulator n=1 Tax=Polyangium aurulentum TaxID=2567896 RepID=UPI0010AE14B9|nr:transcriptional regulator [Polyangium aurulentum]UQA55105.1 transcriptional regulator [Polyangium aurulentum]